MESPLSVAILSKHEALLESLSALLDKAPGIRLLSVTDDEQLFIQDIKLLTPDVAIVDDVAIRDVPTLCLQLRHASERAKIIILTAAFSAEIYSLPRDADLPERSKPVRLPDLVSEIEGNSLGP